ncbi:PREDICTED: cytoskeleton-associated protein 2-like isoform X2 [Priapulus caudatus]|uniref:Cytoskeleton-associated protein 2-like isoform X2 n=1 Tax=Priapulus caudatus TaxID=37621 RepID=A0ABM1E588_PRICU|nr:PREDICTED: cytoskeleton-associated protein 2-like isoform X2 [Priapulus caudatus]
MFLSVQSLENKQVRAIKHKGDQSDEKGTGASQKKFTGNDANNSVSNTYTSLHKRKSPFANKNSTENKRDGTRACKLVKRSESCRPFTSSGQQPLSTKHAAARPHEDGGITMRERLETWRKMKENRATEPKPQQKPKVWNSVMNASATGQEHRPLTAKVGKPVTRHQSVSRPVGKPTRNMMATAKPTREAPMAVMLTKGSPSVKNTRKSFSSHFHDKVMNPQQEAKIWNSTTNSVSASVEEPKPVKPMTTKMGKPVVRKSSMTKPVAKHTTNMATKKSTNVATVLAKRSPNLKNIRKSISSQFRRSTVALPTATTSRNSAIARSPRSQLIKKKVPGSDKPQRASLNNAANGSANNSTVSRVTPSRQHILTTPKAPSSGTEMTSQKRRRRTNSFTLELDESNSRDLPVATPPIKQKRRTVHFSSKLSGSAEGHFKPVKTPGRSSIPLPSPAPKECRRRPSLLTPTKVSPRRRSVATMQRRSPRKSISTPLQGRKVEKENIKQKLNTWLESRSKTPTRYRHMMCFGCHPHNKALPQEKRNLKSRVSMPTLARPAKPKPVGQFLEETLASMGDAIVKRQDLVFEELSGLLQECNQLVDEGCPTESITEWLDEIAEQMPLAKHTAKYWVVQSRLVERTGDTAAVLEVFNRAIARHAAKPAEELAMAMQQFLERLQKKSQPVETAAPSGGHETNLFTDSGNEIYGDTPNGSDVSHGTSASSKRKYRRRWTEGAPSLSLATNDGKVVVSSGNRGRQALQECNMFESTVVKYSISTNTPIFRKVKSALDLDLPTPSAIVTPVRRSTRWELSGASLPSMLADHDKCVRNLEELTEDDKENLVYKPNDALQISY